MFEETLSKYSLQSKMADFNRLRRNKNVNPRNQIVSLLVVALIAGSSFFFAKRVTQPVHVAEKSSAAGLNTVKIMEVYYFPPASSYAQQQLQVFNKSLATKIYIENASAYHGISSLQAISFNSSNQYIRNTARPTGADYREVLISILNDTQNGPSLCELIEQNKLDQVWVWADTDNDQAPAREWMINNVTSNYGNTDIDKNTTLCKNTTRTFSVLSLAYNSVVTFAVHSFAHFMEGLITGIEGFDMFVGRFEGVQSLNGRDGAPIPPYVLTEKCGRVHVPPNVPYDTVNSKYPGYTYYLTNVVNSNCANWTPDGSGVKSPVSSATWVQNPIPSTSQDSELKTFNVAPLYLSDELHYLTWWMQQFAHESSGVSFEGKKIPSWWSFVANTDDVINAYLNIGGYFFKPDLLAPVAATQTAFCTNESGTYSSCTYTPGSITLGASTENKNVLAATTYGDMALVTVSYGNASATVSSVTFCGDAMTRVGTGPFSGAGTKNEMWYKLTPQSGVCPVTVKFSVDPGQRVVSTTIFNNIDQVVPVTGFTTGGLASGFTANPGAITATLTGPKDSLMICGYAHYSEQSNPPSGNFATANAGTSQLWTFKQAKYASGVPVNTWAGLGAGVQRLNANQSTTLSWKTVKTQPNSYTCANFNVKPFASTTTTPTTTVDIKAQAGDGPVTIPYNSSLTISWSSTLATSCTASGAWTGAKGINGSQVIAGVVTSGTYTITCNGKSDSVSVVVTPPTVDLKIGTSNGPYTVPYNGSFTLSWTAPGATACTASGAWTGAKLAGGSLLVTAVTTNRTYTLTCNGGTDSISVVVTQPTVDLKVGTSDGPVNVAYNGSFTLSWTTKLATACTASGSWTGAQLLNGSLVVNNVIANKTYTLTCNGVTDTISIVSLPPVVTVDLKASYSDGPVNLLWGDSVWLTWYTTNATSCTASNGWTGTKAANGTEYFYPLTTTKTYTITCGGKTDSVTVNVAPLPAPTESGNITFKLITPTTLPTTFTRGQVVTLVYRIAEPDGTPGTPDEGFGVQTYVDNTVQSVVGVNAEYNTTTGNWTSTFTMPSVAGTYTYYTSGYCGRWKSGRYSCGYKYTTFQRQQSPNPSVTIVVK